MAAPTALVSLANSALNLFFVFLAPFSTWRHQKLILNFAHVGIHFKLIHFELPLFKGNLLFKKSLIIHRSGRFFFNEAHMFKDYSALI